MRNILKVPSRSGVAILAMIGAAALIAVTSIIGKALGFAAAETAALHPLQVSAGRFSFALLALVTVVLLFPKIRPGFDGANWPLHLMRSICGWSGVTAMFAAVAAMPVAEATAISFLSPIVTMAFAAIMLNEQLGLRKVLASLLALIGAGLILRPGTDTFQIAGLFALLAAILMGLEAIFIKRLSENEPAMRILAINNGIGSVIALTAATLVWVSPSPTQWLLLIALGVFMVTAQTLFIAAMKRGAASTVMPAFYFVLVFAALYDLVLFDVVPSIVAVVGSAMIVASAILLSRIKT